MLEKIKSNTQISHVFQYGRRIGGPYVMLIVMHCNERHGRDGRVAFIAGKRFGNAVWRNGAKRRMRAVCHDIGYEWKDCDVLFVARKNILHAPYKAVIHSVQSQLQRI